MELKLRAAALTLLAASIAIPVLAQDAGADTYKTQCQMCHGAEGDGNTPAGKAMKAKPFKDPDIIKASDADLIAIIKKGKGMMPSFAGKLKDDQIKDVVTYIRTLQQK